MKEEYLLTYDESYGDSLLGEYVEESFRGTKEKVYSRYKEMKKELKIKPKLYIFIEIWKKV